MHFGWHYVAMSPDEYRGLFRETRFLEEFPFYRSSIESKEQAPASRSQGNELVCTLPRISFVHSPYLSLR